MKKTYSIVFNRSAIKDIRSIPRSIVDRIKLRINELGENPLPHDATPLSGYSHYYRVRIGNYRIVYHVAKQIRIITVIRIGHRKDIYKKI